MTFIKINNGSDGGGAVTIPQEEYSITHDVNAANEIGFFQIGVSGLGQFLCLMTFDHDTPPIIGNDLFDLFIPKSIPNLNGDLTITEENTPPVGSVQIYGRPSSFMDADGNARACLNLYAATAGSFQDEYGRVYKVYQTTLPASDAQMFPLFVNPAASDEREYISCPGFGGDCRVLSEDGGFFNVRGNANTLPLLIHPGAADKSLALFYDNAGSGVDIQAPSGYSDPNSGGCDLSLIKASFTVYFDISVTDPSMRFFHRSPLTTNDLKIEMGNKKLFLDVFYDATGTRGVPVYFSSAGFPGSFVANLPGGASSTFKTSSTSKGYQSNNGT